MLCAFKYFTKLIPEDFQCKSNYRSGFKPDFKKVMNLDKKIVFQILFDFLSVPECYLKYHNYTELKIVYKWIKISIPKNS